MSAVDPNTLNRRNIHRLTASAVMLAASILLPCSAAAQTTIRVNCGGPAYTDPYGRYWSADYGHSGSEGVYNAGSQPINNTNSPTLYQTKRYSPWNSEMTYTFAVDTSMVYTYAVTLKFAELAWDLNRRFDVIINGRQAMTNHSVYTSAPGAVFTAVDRTYTVAVTNGQIQIRFVPKVSSATINAIEILPVTAFTDVPGPDPNGAPGAPYYHEVHFLREARITTGCTDTTFCPDQPITRGQMAVFVVRGLYWALKGTPENFTYPTTPYFTDVLPSHPWFKYIQKLRELGITIGCTTTTFCPDQSILWGQLAVFAVRAWQYRHYGQVADNFCPSTLNPCIPTTNPRLVVLGRPTPVEYFPADTTTTHPWYNWIQKAVNLNLVDFVPTGKVYGSCRQQPRSTVEEPPTGEGRFCPGEPIPRGEAAVMLARGVMGIYHPYSPLSQGIGPSKAEVNLGPLPVDKYLDATSGISAGLTMCRDVSLTVRGCIQRFFAPDMVTATYRADGFPQQGIRGVRFFFPLGSGGYSTPFHTNGTVDVEHWIPRLKAFFSDLKAYGVERVIPTPVFMGTWSGMGEAQPPLCDGCFAYKSQSVDTCGGTDLRYFYPWVPFGFKKCGTEFYMDGWKGINCNGGGFPDAYNCAAGQPPGLFPGWSGWTNFFNLFREILKAARETQMAIGEFDLENELKVGGVFTVQARLLYDNKNLTDVVGGLRAIAASEGFSSDIVTISTPLDRASSANYDCVSVYGDSAWLISSSALNYAMSGFNFGGEAGAATPDGLSCGGTITGPSLPATPSGGLFRTTDIHAHICISGGTSNDSDNQFACSSLQDCLLDYPDNGTCSRFDSKETANLVYNRIRDFMGRYAHTALRMGEANSGQRCDDHTPVSARHAADGYRNSTLRAVFGNNVYFTAWNNASDTSYCSETPYFLPHFNPFAQ